ncbi:MAG: GDSL-type esterase/lipase family protein [Candidatus Zixiibacteriota bacterium]|jgi:lysophospholipase L1-like esterase
MLRKLAYSAAVFVIFLITAELASRLIESRITEAARASIEPGWQTRFFGSLFDWNEPDPELLWRFKANLANPLIRTNSQHLIGNEVTVSKPPGYKRILLLGDSSPVGLGLQSYRQTFGELLVRLLNAQIGRDTEVQLINAAVTGYTSEQIDQYLKLRGWQYQPDLVIVYCGNNDASISGPVTDRELIEAQELQSVRSLFGHLALYRVMRAVMAEKRPAEQPSPASLVVRVPADRYGANLSDIAGQCREHDCPLIILKPPVPYLWPAGLQFKVFTNVKGSEGETILPDAIADILGRDLKYCLSRNIFDTLYGSGDVFTRNVYSSAYHDNLPPEEAIAFYNRMIQQGETEPLTYNNLGVSYWEDGDFIRANEYLEQARSLYAESLPSEPPPALLAAGSPFLYNIGINRLSSEQDWSAILSDSTSDAWQYLDSALQADYFSLRIKETYYDEIDNLKGDRGVTVIDLPRVFRQNESERLFIDHCHPTAEGHLLIARILYDSLAARKF